MTYNIDDIYIGRICMISDDRLFNCPFYSAFNEKYNISTKKDKYYLIDRGKQTRLTMNFKHHYEFGTIDCVNFLSDEYAYYYVDDLIKLKDALLIEPTPRTLEFFQIHSYLSYINKIEKQRVKTKKKIK